jgi:hypothetical protein
LDEKQCKPTNNITNTEKTTTIKTITTNTTSTVTISDFSKRLSDLKSKDSQVLQKAAQISRNNYK